LIQPPGSPSSHRDSIGLHSDKVASKAVAQKQGKFCRHSEGSNLALSATRSVSPENSAGDPANAPLSAARWLMDRTRDAQGLWCRAKKRG
jgi:hypothetical protein